MKNREYHQLSPEERKRIVALYLDGYSTGEIERLTGRAQSTVTRTCQLAGAKRPSIRELRAMTPDELERARSLYEGGFSLRECGEMMNRKPSTIRKKLREMGVEIRQPYGYEQRNTIRVPARRIQQVRFLYLEMHMSCEMIAKVLNIAPNTARRDLRLGAVPRRSHAEAISLSYKLGRRELAPQCRPKEAA